MIGRVLGKQARDLDERLGLAKVGRTALNYIFPDHWSFMLGEIALYSFLILVVTGVYLAFFFVSSDADTIYHGAYVPLRGLHMSEAYESVVHISTSVRAGLVMRQMHHWAAHVFIGAIGVHMCRIFFTGAFRRPREINWTIGLTLMLLAVMNGFFGYSLPDDLLSGTGLRIAYSITESVPFVGTWVAQFLWGGHYPGTFVIEHMYVLHVFVIPVLILGLIGAHLGGIMRQHHTQFPRKGATETNVVGTPMWPAYAARSLGYFFMTFAVIAALGGVAQINPIWEYGPYSDQQITTFAQPDWYVGWLEGSLRLFPNWEMHFPGHMVPEQFFSGVALPVVLIGLLYSWPFLEAHVTRDRAHHNLLDRPRDRPVRTAMGAGLLTFWLVLLVAGSDDVITLHLHASIYVLVWTLRVLLFLGPVVVGVVTYVVCKELQDVPGAGFRTPPPVVVRTRQGAYTALPGPPHPLDADPEPEPYPAEEATGPVDGPRSPVM